MNARILGCWILAGVLGAGIGAQIRPGGTPMTRQPPLSIDGQVLVEEGAKTTVRARVLLYREMELVREVIAEPDGKFRFADVPAGNYRIVARMEGYRPMEETVDLTTRGRGYRRVVIHLKPDVATQEIPDSATVTVAELQVPKKAWDEYLRAQEELQAGKYPKAVQRFEKAIKLHAPFLKAWLGLGIACRCQGDAAGAERAFRESLRLDERNLMARLNLGELCAATSRSEEARRIFEDTALMYPEEGEPHVDLGKLHYQAGRVDEAEAEWRLASRLQHTRPEVHLLLARIYRERRQLPQLVAELEAYLAKAPDGPQAEPVRLALDKIQKR